MFKILINGGYIYIFFFIVTVYYLWDQVLWFVILINGGYIYIL